MAWGKGTTGKRKSVKKIRRRCEGCKLCEKSKSSKDMQNLNVQKSFFELRELTPYQHPAPPAAPSGSSRS